MTAFEKLNGFIMQLADVYLPITPQEKERLQAELTLIEKTGYAQLFQAIYDTWQSLFVNGVRCYLTGEAEKWYTFYFLDMIRENPLEREAPTSVLSKVTFVVPKNRQEKAKRYASSWSLPKGMFEMEIEQDS